MITGKGIITLSMWLDSIKMCQTFYKACENVNIDVDPRLLHTHLMKEDKFLCTIDVPNKRCIKRNLIPEFLRLLKDKDL